MTTKTLLALVGIVTASLPIWSQPKAPAEGPIVSLMVTVESRKGKEAPPVIGLSDVMIFQGKERRAPISWTPLQESKSGIELYVLIDDGLSSEFGSQLDDVRKFLASLPSSTRVAVGYMRNGTVDTVQQFTTDHAVAAKSLRIPLGSPGISPSPYFSLSDLVKRWPQTPTPREVVMITDGIDGLGTNSLENPYVLSAIENLQRSGIVVNSIYFPGGGHQGHSYWRLNWGQNYLSQVSEETGGETYNVGLQAPVSISPYLRELNERFNHQFVLTFVATPGKKAGLQAVSVKTEVPNADLVSADRVFVPAAR